MVTMCQNCRVIYDDNYNYNFGLNLETDFLGDPELASALGLCNNCFNQLVGTA